MTAPDLTLDDVLHLIRDRFADQIDSLAETCDCAPCTLMQAQRGSRTKPCATCGKTVHRAHGSSIGEWLRRKYCDQQCAKEGQRRPAETKVCALDACGKTFTRPPATSQARWDRRRYCTTACGARGRAEEAETKPCAACRKTFARPTRRSDVWWAERRYCSRGCGNTGRAQTPAKSKPAAVKQSPKVVEPAPVPAPPPAPAAAPAAPQRPVWRPAGWSAQPNIGRAS